MAHTHPLQTAVGATTVIGMQPVMAGTHDTPNAIVCQGWVLKKRRKKMQGFARRYFILHQSGILSYSFEPGQPFRDHISLHHAAISTSPGRKDIHVDSNIATFHMKCLSNDDFTMWMSAFRKFISLGIEARKSATHRLTSRHSLNVNKSGQIADLMGSTISSLEDSMTLLVQDLPALSKKHLSLGKKSDKEKLKETGKGSGFGLFKRAASHTNAPEPSYEQHPTSEFGNELPPSVQTVLSIVATLKSQHEALLNSMQTLAESSRSISGSPLPSTVEEEIPITHTSSPASLYRTPSHMRRISSLTSASEGTLEWFDALDGAEEFVLDDEGPTPDVTEPPEPISQTQSLKSVDHLESTSQSVDSSRCPTPEPPPQIARTSSKEVVRRTKLPVPVTGDEGSLFTVLKKNVGKDLSTIALPVSFNEPLTLLQRAAEELEYYALLDKAAEATDSVSRFCYIAAFAVSSYAHTRHRSGRKGFNPMLGETYEEPRMKFIAEKVRHNPVQMAYHAEGDHWELSATSSGKTKFWGKSLEIIPLGSTHLRIGQDHYVWKKPSSFMRNLMVGTKYLEHSGEMTIENSNDGTRCILNFKQNGYWGASNAVSGSIFGESGKEIGRVDGKWDDQMAQELDSSNFRVLWRINPFPVNAHDYYGFTSFGITLNEITPDIEHHLPPTDSRLRPDVRALEDGEIDLAEEEKVRVEEMQRERRRQGQDRQPRWFREVGDEWLYAGGYWEARARGWKGEEIHPLWFNSKRFSRQQLTYLNIFIVYF